MKLTITFFTTKLESFINETNETDENLLMLLLYLTDSIQDVVLSAKVIKTNHSIESVIDKNILTCENIFECLACNAQTGKTYVSVVNHINTSKQTSQVKKFEKERNQQQRFKNIISTSEPNTKFEMISNQTIPVINFQLPILNGPLPHLQNYLNNLNQQRVIPFLPVIRIPVLIRTSVGATHGQPFVNQIHGNAIYNANNNNTLNAPEQQTASYSNFWIFCLKVRVGVMLSILNLECLVRARHINMDLDCDITFNNELAMANNKLIKYFYRIQPESQKLVVFVKMLTEKLKLHPQINTYTINLLVFFYFQIKGYLPKVMNLIEASTLKYWPNEFTQKTSEELQLKVTTETFNELCLGFMEYYAHNVDFDSNVLSTFTGSTIPKSLFGTEEYRAINDCCDGLLRYMEENTGAAECIRTNFKMAMCVQDPFSHDHNVSRCVGKSNLKRFRECCRETHEFLIFQSAGNDSS